MDTYLSITSSIVQASVVILLIRRRIYREFPLFCAYMIWVSIAALASVFAASRLQLGVYERFFFISSIFDAAFMFSILVEMSMSVLKPVKSMLPRWTILVVAGLLSMAAFGVWHIASPPGAIKLSEISQCIIHLDITTSVLRVVFFVSLAALSQLLSLGWRDRVVQISTGLGFFSLVSLAVTFVHMNQEVGREHLNDLYHSLDQIVVYSYIISMGYWLVCFAKDVRERQEFTPQMQHFIVSLAQNVRSTRLAMSDSDVKTTRLY